MSEKQFAGITALATYLPEKRESNIELVGETTAKKMGIIERPIAADDETAGDMALKAAERLLEEYGIKREEVRFVLLCIEFPDYILPNTACHIASRLHLPKSVGAVDYNLGCSGYVYGLALAKGLIETGLTPNVLLLTCNKSSDYANVKDMNLRPLFGDCGTATFVEAAAAEKPLLDSFVFGTDGTGFDKLYIPVGGGRNLVRKTPEVEEKEPNGNTRTNYDLHMDGMGIFYFTMRNVPKLVDEVLAKSGLTREDIDYYVFHQPNGFIMQELQKKCRLVGMPYYCNIEHIGNTVASTVPFGLEYILKEKQPQDLKNVMLAGFGVGLSWGGCVADLSGFHTPVMP